MEQIVARFLATSAAALALAVPVHAHAGGSRCTDSAHCVPAHPAGPGFAPLDAGSKLDGRSPTDRAAG